MTSTVWGGNILKRFCKMFTQSSTGRWAVLQLPCCPCKQRELLENMLQNLRNKWPPYPVTNLMIGTSPHPEDQKSGCTVPVGDSECCPGNGTIEQWNNEPNSQCIPFSPLFRFLCDILRPHKMCVWSLNQHHIWVKFRRTKQGCSLK